MLPRMRLTQSACGKECVASIPLSTFSLVPRLVSRGAPASRQSHHDVITCMLQLAVVKQTRNTVIHWISSYRCLIALAHSASHSPTIEAIRLQRGCNARQNSNSTRCKSTAAPIFAAACLMSEAVVPAQRLRVLTPGT